MTSEAMTVPSTRRLVVTSPAVHISHKPLSTTSGAVQVPSDHGNAMTSQAVQVPCSQSVVMNFVSNKKEESFIVKISDGLITSTNRNPSENGVDESTKADTSEPEVITDTEDKLMSLVNEACRDTQTPNGVSPTTDTDMFSHTTSTCFWDRESSLLLIDLHTSHRSLFSDAHYKKKTVWEMVAGQMRERGCQYTWNQVESKWKSMTKKFRDTVDHNEKYGHVVMHTCSYFNELAAVYKYKPDVVKMTLDADLNRCGSAAIAGGNHIATKRSIDEVQTVDTESEVEGGVLRKKKKYQCNGSARYTKNSGNLETSGDQCLEQTPELFRFLRSLHDDRKCHDAANMAKIENMHKEKMAIFRSFLDVFREFVSKQNKQC